MKILHSMSNKAQAKDNGAAPLAGSGFGREPVDAFNFVVIGLGHGGVGFVAAGRAVAFVLEIDACRGFQGFFQSSCPNQRRGPPNGQHPADRLGNLDPPLGAHFLSDQFLGENRLEVGWREGLLGSRVQWRRDWFGQVGLKIVPGRGNFFFAQEDALGIHGFTL